MTEGVSPTPGAVTEGDAVSRVVAWEGDARSEAGDGPPAVAERGDGERGGEVSDDGESRPRHARPTSRRGRDHVRRTGSHSVVVVPGDDGYVPRHARPPGGSGRPASAAGTGLGTRARAWARGRPLVPMSRRSVERRRAWLVVGMAAAAATGAGLSVVGASVVRNSTAGQYVDSAIGPDEPGYQAYVVATPTLAVVQAGAGGDLAAVALLSLNPGDDGGSVTLVPPSVVVPDVAATGGTTDGTGDEGSGDGEAAADTAEGTLPGADLAGGTVADAYDGGGADAVVHAAAELLGVAIEGGVELDEQGWADTVEGVGPITVSLPESAGPWPAGESNLDPADVGAFMLDQAEGEGELGLLDRQAAFWRSWPAAVGAAGGEGGGSGLARFIGAMSRGVSAEVLPVVEGQDADGDAALEAAEPGTSELIARAVPYPLSPAPGRRVRVRLLNGTADRDLTAEVVPLLVGAGAEITIAGNADTFDVTQTTYAYAEPDAQDDAQRLADAVGVGRVERFERVTTTATTVEGDSGATVRQEIEDEIDMTIVLGTDVQDLIRRLQSSG